MPDYFAQYKKKNEPQSNDQYWASRNTDWEKFDKEDSRGNAIDGTTVIMIGIVIVLAIFFYIVVPLVH